MMSIHRTASERTLCTLELLLPLFLPFGLLLHQLLQRIVAVLEAAWSAHDGDSKELVQMATGELCGEMAE